MCQENELRGLNGSDVPQEGLDKETLRRALQFEWNDHYQMCRQTWRSLQIEAVLLAGLIAADFKLDNRWVVLALGLVVIAATLLGALITVHHRKGQRRKFIHIDRLEEALGLHRPGLLDDVHPPEEFGWKHIYDFKKWNTPLFMLRAHICVLLFAVIYVVAGFII